jgi:hypothetical protein
VRSTAGAPSIGWRILVYAPGLTKVVDASPISVICAQRGCDSVYIGHALRTFMQIAAACCVESKGKPLLVAAAAALDHDE